MIAAGELAGMWRCNTIAGGKPSFYIEIIELFTPQ